ARRADPDPVVVRDAVAVRGLRVDAQLGRVLYLPRPRVVAEPGVVVRHAADAGEQHEIVALGPLLVDRRDVLRQRIVPEALQAPGTEIDLPARRPEPALPVFLVAGGNRPEALLAQILEGQARVLQLEVDELAVAAPRVEVEVERAALPQRVDQPGRDVVIAFRLALRRQHALHHREAGAVLVDRDL